MALRSGDHRAVERLFLDEGFLAVATLCTIPGRSTGDHGTTPWLHLAATSTEAHDWSVIYAPNDRAVDFKPAALSTVVKATWFNPRTGESAKANAVANAASTKFTTPSAADWVLVLETRK